MMYLSKESYPIGKQDISAYQLSENEDYTVILSLK